MPESKELNIVNTINKSGKVFPRISQVFVDYLTLSINGISDHATYFNWVNFQLKESQLKVSNRRVTVPIGYDIGYQICDVNYEDIVCGSLKFSEKYNRVLLELSGKGCQMVEFYNSFSWFESLAQQENNNIKRIDLAIDDFQGRRNIEWFDKAHSRGLFNSSTGRRPVKRNMGDKQNGRTRYIGGQTAYRQVCIYEKGKQLDLDDDHFKEWVRVEVRLNANSRDMIPKEILKCKSDYFFSVYPKAFSYFVKNGKYVPPVYRGGLVFAASLGRSARNSRRQYGKINRELLEVMGRDKGLLMITRPGKSTKLERPSFITNEYIAEVFADLVISSALKQPTK
tara:strand:+ start:48 stop:1064 length:1017 start_codon:yes stop_codon:yes gene_type:complete